MDGKFTVSPFPHIRSSVTTSKIMLNVLLALVPTIIASVIIFGYRSLIVVLFSMLSAAVFEFLWQFLLKKESSIGDFSALVTGMLIALNLPVSVPLWAVFIGNGFAIIIVKQLFGGIGHNFMNPAMAARVFLMVSWAKPMTKWTAPLTGMADATAAATSAATSAATADAVSSATVLTGKLNIGLLDAFLGNMPGCIGEVSALALLIGGIYLIATRTIKPWIPLAFIGTVFILTAIAGENPLMQILSGGLFLGAFFMATDYVTSPVTAWGQIIMGIGCGIITVIIRLYSNSYPEGVSFAILLMNAATPLIDKATVPKIYGEVRHG